MVYKIGDTVEAIDDAISGVVTNISQSIITIEDANGFEFQFEAHQLMPLNNKTDLEQSLYNIDIEAVKKDKQSNKKRNHTTVKAKQRHTPKLVIDLHIHQLVDSTKYMTNFDMLNLQIDTARRQLEFAVKKRIPKLVFIHGVGEGVLKQELETLLGRYNNVQYFDADYKTYGIGAMEVKIFQNIMPNEL